MQRGNKANEGLTPATDPLAKETANSRSSEVFQEGTPVVISGLQSEKGKKLNGGHGIVLSSKPFQNDGFDRYPVLIYLLPKEKEQGGGFDFLDETVRHKFKVENLAVDTDKSPEAKQIKNKACLKYIIKAQDSNDRKGSLFWKGFNYHQVPEEFRIGISYASELHAMGRLQEAYNVALTYVDNQTFREDPKWEDHYYFDLCLVLTAAGKRIEDALELALKIPPDQKMPAGIPGAGENMASKALRLVMDGCNLAMGELGNFEHPMVLLYNRVAELAMERDDGNVHNLLHCAAAHCLADRNLEGAKWYRKAMASGKLKKHDKLQFRESLVVAQMQCPGMPLEQYYIISCQSGRATCIARDRMADVKISRDPQGIKINCIANSNGQVFVEPHPVPQSPDDPRFFPAEFLAQLEEN